MQTIIIAVIVLFCLCAVVLSLSDNRQGSRFLQEISQKRNELQPDTFVCFRCRKRQPMSELSTAIHGMCKACADLFDEMQDE